MKGLFGFLILLVAQIVTAQNMNGIWHGKLTQEPGGCFPEYYIELQLNISDKWVSGISYDYYDTSRFVQLTFNGSISGNSRKKMTITERKVVQERIPEDCTPCLKTYDLTYSRQNNNEILSGTWKGEDIGTLIGCPPGKIYLKKVNQSAFAKKSERVTEVARTLILDSSDVKIEFYDNEEIDGDTISIFLNKEMLVNKKVLSLNPIVLNIPLQVSKEYEIVLFAESLGSIPPNTALMIITSGTAKYEIFLSASDNKNAAVRFRYDKPIK